jgi:hypothetical protein
VESWHGDDNSVLLSLEIFGRVVLKMSYAVVRVMNCLFLVGRNGQYVRSCLRSNIVSTNIRFVPKSKRAFFNE